MTPTQTPLVGSKKKLRILKKVLDNWHKMCYNEYTVEGAMATLAESMK